MSCDTCPINHNPLTYRGRIDAPIVVLAGSPSAEEVEAGQPLTGSPATLLLETLSAEGFDLNEILFCNTLQCHPQDADLVTLKTLQACQDKVEAIIGAHPRKLIICLGAEAWSHTHNLRKIGGVRVGVGKVVHSEKYNCWSVWNVSPVFVTRSPNWKPEFQHSIRRAYQTYTTGQPQRPPAKIYPHPTTLEGALALIARAGSHEVVSFDIETANAKGTNPNYQTHHILGIGFGWSDAETYKKSAFYLPIVHGVDCEPVWSISEWMQIDAALREHIFVEGKKLVAQNGKFDTRFLRHQYNYHCPVWFDTIIAHRLIDENKSHSLKSMARFWLNAPDWDVFDKLEAGEHLGEYTLEEVAEYCAYDSVYTFELHELFYDMLEGQPYEKVFWELDQPLFNELINVELEGMTLDMEASKLMEVALLEEMQAARQTTNELSGWAGRVLPHKDKRNKNGELKKGIELGINPNSHTDVGFILYDHFNVPLPTDKYERKKCVSKEGKGKTDKITIDFHLHRKSEYNIIDDDGVAVKVEDYVIPLDAPVRKFIESMQHERSLRTLYGNAIKNVRENLYPDGRVHTNYGFSMRDDNNSPVSGRLSSNSPNMQNVKKEFKPMFVPSHKGWKIIEADESQSEIRVWAYFSQDKNLLSALTTGDFHTTNAAMMMKKDIADVTKEDRKISKVLSFGGILYQGLESVITRSIHCTTAEATKLLEEAYTLYADGKKWIDDIILFCHEYGYVETIMGRRRRLPEIWSSNPAEVKSAERQAVNSPVQGSSASIVNMAIVAVAKRLRDGGYEGRIVNTVHDSIAVECPPHEVDAICEIMQYEMTKPIIPEFNIPLAIEIEVYDRWGGEIDLTKICGKKVLDSANDDEYNDCIEEL